jgi:hypothetical protein
MSESQVVRVTRQSPCKICSKSTWCGYSSDGTTAFCMRVESTRQAKNGAWIHRLDEPLLPVPPPPKAPDVDMAERLAVLRRGSRLGLLEAAAQSLGVSSGCLESMGCFIRKGALAFPMWRGGKAVGILYRAENGQKWSEPGSKHGLFRPQEPLVGRRLVVCEGATDTAAMLTAMIAGCGRPSCLGQEDEVAKLAKGKELIIIADRDKPKTLPDGREWNPGRDGGVRLAKACLETAWRVKFVRPPGAKDMREWLTRRTNRLTLRSFEEVVAAADFFEETPQ